MTNKIILTEENSITTALWSVWTEAIKNELQKTVDFSKKLTITDLEDKQQFKIVKDTKNWYVKTRNTIKRAFKSKRDEYNALAKENIQAEKDVISVIEIEEKRLNDLIEKAELEKLKKDNALILNDRKEALKKCECEIADEMLLIMKEKDFEDILTEKRLEFVAKEEAKLKAEQERIAREKELEEAKKQARIEAEKEAEIQRELEKQKVELEKQEAERKQKEELERIEREKQEEIERLKKEQEEKELAEKKRKWREKRETEEKEKKEKKEKELLEKRKDFIEYRDSLDFDHYEDMDWKRIFYKKVWEFNIE